MALFADRAAALDGYDLSEAEVAALRLVDAESLDACGSIGRRICLGSHRFGIDKDQATHDQHG
jgi:hypothetical protein